jgi:hypothetical protein
VFLAENGAKQAGSHNGKVNEPLPAALALAVRNAKTRSHDAEKPCRMRPRTIETLKHRVYRKCCSEGGSGVELRYRRMRGDPLNLIRVMPAKGQGCTEKRHRSPRGESSVNIIGAGIAGTWHALLFARAGYDVTLHERDDAAMTQATSHWAGGMLAPWCERETSEPVIMRLGIRSLDLWREQAPDTPFNGSLVVAHPRDRTDFERFARLTTDYEYLDAPGIANIEPSLAGRFREACCLPAKAMSSRAPSCRNCMRSSLKPAGPSSSAATGHPKTLQTAS